MVPLAQYADVPPILDNWLQNPSREELKVPKRVKVKMEANVLLPVDSDSTDVLQSGIDYIKQRGNEIAEEKRSTPQFMNYERQREKYQSSRNKRLEELYLPKRESQQSTAPPQTNKRKNDGQEKFECFEKLKVMSVDNEKLRRQNIELQKHIENLEINKPQPQFSAPQPISPSSPSTRSTVMEQQLEEVIAEKNRLKEELQNWKNNHENYVRETAARAEEETAPTSQQQPTESTPAEANPQERARPKIELNLDGISSRADPGEEESSPTALDFLKDMNGSRRPSKESSASGHTRHVLNLNDMNMDYLGTFFIIY